MTNSLDIVLPADDQFSLTGGALATVTYELGRALRRRGVRVRVVSPFIAGNPLHDLDVLSLNFGRCRPFAARAALRAWAEISGRRVQPDEQFRNEVMTVLATGPDPVVVHNDALLARELASMGRRVVLWLHNWIGSGEPGSLSTLPSSVHLVAVSDYVRRWTAGYHNITLEAITVIHPGIDAIRFHPSLRCSTGRPLQVVCHARIDPNKGQVLAARAVAALRAEGLPVELTIVGEPRTYGMPRAVVREYGKRLRAAVRAAEARTAGWMPMSEIPSLLRTFDIALLVPTVPEPFGLAGLEAMASGCALVAVPHGGIAEWAGGAAVLVDANEASVASGIRSLVSDRAELLRRAELGRERALCFKWWDVASRLLDVLEVHSRKKGGLSVSCQDSCQCNKSLNTSLPYWRI